MPRCALFILLCLLSACSRQPLHESDRSGSLPRSNEAQPTSKDDAQPGWQPRKDTGMGVVIGYTDVPLTKAQPESTLGNFVADAMLRAAQDLDPEVAAAVYNYGGIRMSYLPPGAITIGHLQELMPFKNKLTIVDMPGTVVQALCDHIAARRGWPVSGLSFVIENKLAQSIRIGGELVAPSLMYKIAISDYLARGGDQCTFLQVLQKQVTTYMIRDALIAHLVALKASGKPLRPVLQQRIRYAGQ